MKIRFASVNEQKIRDAGEFLQQSGIEIVNFPVRIVETQSNGGQVFRPDQYQAMLLFHELIGPDLGVLLITHYQRILNYITPDFVHVMIGGRIVKSGGKELAHELEEKGYEGVRAELGLGEPDAAA